ncbi:MAG: hypothetical protein ACOYNN_08625 [Terrimicrobiaceae bacterium]
MSSAVEMSRPGAPDDLYYYDGENHRKQAFATTQNTKYVQQFANLTGGSSVFTIPPQNGVQDVVCSFQMAQFTASTDSSIALPQGWGYALIKQVSFRYGGSSQYFLTGDQILQNAIQRQTSRTAVDDLINLGGNFALNSASAGAWGNAAQNAYVVLTLPHATPSGVGKAHPFPTDLLTQQVQITVELYQPWQVVSASTGGATTPSAANVTLTSASFQVQQVMLNNQGDALARRVDMATNAYAFPCEFIQQVQRINLVSSASPQSVVLTGFRSGEVKAIRMWLTNSTDQGLIGGNATNVNFNPLKWYQPTNVQMLYAGDIYARYDVGVSQLFNLINGSKANVFDGQTLTSAGGVFTNTSTLAFWTELPFAQTFMDEDAHNVLVHGKPITNGIVNLLIQTPTAAATWVLNISYVYNSTLLMSQGTADFVF